MYWKGAMDKKGGKANQRPKETEGLTVIGQTAEKNCPYKCPAKIMLATLF